MMGLIDRCLIKQPRLRQFVCRALEGNADLQVEVLGTRLHINTIKEHGYLRASRLVRTSALLREEIPVLLNLASLFAEHDTFVDVGANVGVYCLTFARFRHFYPGARIYAFEANPDTYARLLPQANALQVHAENLALADHEGTLEFVPGAVSHVFTTVDHANSYSLAAPVVRVPCRRLDQCAVEGNSLIIKIDVEGQELRVLEGARGLLEEGRVKAIYIDGYDDSAVKELLLEYGFALREGKTLEQSDGEVFNLLAVHERHQSEETSSEPTF